MWAGFAAVGGGWQPRRARATEVESTMAELCRRRFIGGVRLHESNEALTVVGVSIERCHRANASGANQLGSGAQRRLTRRAAIQRMCGDGGNPRWRDAHDNGAMRPARGNTAGSSLRLPDL